MDKDTLTKYSPMAVVLLSLFIQWNVFVTPEKLEIKHREIINDIAQVYVPKEQYNAQYNDMKQELSAMRQKIDKIYEIVTRK